MLTKITKDLLFTQLKWSYWYVPIVFVIYLCFALFIPEFKEHDMNFFEFFYEPTKIYMLVLGIVVYLAMFSHFAKFGVTRKDYFFGSTLATFVLAVCLVVASAILTIIAGLFEPFSGDFHLSFIDPNTNWAMLALSLTVLFISYYVAGWLISVGFYRYGGWGGMGYILIAIVYIALTDLIWGRDLLDLVSSILPITFSQMPALGSIISTVILFGVGLLIIRNVTKRVRVKLE